MDLGASLGRSWRLLGPLGDSLLLPTPALSRHPTTDAGMWGAGKEGLAAQDRMMPGCRVS